MRKVIALGFISVLLVGFSNEIGASRTTWRVVREGLEYTSIRVSPGIIHAFRVDPQKYRLDVVTAKELGKKNSTIKTMAKEVGAVLAINGGFFSPEHESLGLLIKDGKQINPLKNTSWWSVFFMRGETPHIVHSKGFRPTGSMSMALQCGPRLVIGGSVPRLKPSIAERSAVCTTYDKKVIFVATENLLITMSKLADYLRAGISKGGLGCSHALNLDGGSSTQLYAKVDSFGLDVKGINRVTNGIAVFPKK